LESTKKISHARSPGSLETQRNAEKSLRSNRA
jgi:hypothetical protein